MKLEQVKSGEAATPPTETPTKTATDKYTYTFSNWDTDYSAITANTIISAYFTANKIVKTDTTTNSSTKTPSSSSTTSSNSTATPSTSVVPSTNVTPSANNASDASADSISKEPVKYSYMGSPSSPKTGDETPIVIALLAMLASAGGAVVLRKKSKEE